jgi:glucose/arabinose dehydrogenase
MRPIEHRFLGPCLILGVLLLLGGCGAAVTNGGGGSTPPPTPSGPPPQLALSSFVSGLALPLGFEAPSDSTHRIFIIEQGGTIRIVQNGSVVVAPFLDITSRLTSGGETGLLGLAFHPSFSTNRRFFVDYTRTSGSQLQSVISEFTVPASSPNQADPASERILLVVNQPFSNHNGGQLAFGPDGFLYIAFGDGGSGGDPLGNGQNKNALLGKILRIGVDAPFASGKQYAIPSDNPFATGGGALEIYGYGFRNPWRFSFDRSGGQLFIGDVGQGNWEEVDIGAKGGDFGWNIMEGNHCYPPGTASCNMTGLTAPIAEYDHSSAGGTAIIGGFVYRGTVITGLVGAYVYGDLSSGHVWGLKQDSSGNWQATVILNHNLTVSAFGQDAAGELYLVDYGHGAVMHLIAAP